MADEQPAPAAENGGPADAAEPDTEKVFYKEITIRRFGGEDVVGIFADHAVVQHTSEHFTLYFFQSQVPLTEERADLEALTEMPAKCVARIVVGPRLMGELFAAMQKNLTKYNKLVEYLQKHGEGEEVK